MLRLSTCSDRSFSDETVKNFSQVSCRFGQSTNVCLTVNGSLQDSQTGWSSPSVLELWRWCSRCWWVMARRNPRHDLRWLPRGAPRRRSVAAMCCWSSAPCCSCWFCFWSWSLLPSPSTTKPSIQRYVSPISRFSFVLVLCGYINPLQGRGVSWLHFSIQV